MAGFSGVNAKTSSSLWQNEFKLSRGELIPSKMYTYHSISELECLVPEHQTLSLDTTSQSAKIFQGKKVKSGSLLALLQGENDMQLLINQQELIKNILEPFQQSHKASTYSMEAGLPPLTENIIDYTLCSRNRLYILYPKLLAVLDLSNLFVQPSHHSPTKTIFDSQPVFLDSVPLTQLYSSITSVSLPNQEVHLLLQHASHKTQPGAVTLTQVIMSGENSPTRGQENNGAVLLSDIFETNQVQYKLSGSGSVAENTSNRQVKDIYVPSQSQYVTVLMDRNEVQVIDLVAKSVVFKAEHKDTSAKISRAFYIDPGCKWWSGATEETESEEECENFEEVNRFKDDEILGEENDDQEISSRFQRHLERRLPAFRDAMNKELSPSPNIQNSPLQGFFLFVETQSMKESNGQKSHSQFEKLSIAKIINKATGNSSKPFDQRLQQIDYLKISDKSRKLVEFDEKRGLIFLMNNKVVSQQTPNQQSCLKLYTVQLKLIYSDSIQQNGSDSEEDHQKSHPPKGLLVHTPASGVKFSFVKGMHLELSSQVIHNISTSQTSKAKKTRFFKFIVSKSKKESPSQSIQDQTYYMYTSIGNQILVHSLSYQKDLQAPIQSLAPLMTPILPSFHQVPNFLSHHYSSATLLHHPSAISPSPLQPVEQSSSIFGQDPFFSSIALPGINQHGHYAEMGGGGEGVACVSENEPEDQLDELSKLTNYAPESNRTLLQQTVSFGGVSNNDYQGNNENEEIDESMAEVKREIDEAIEKEMELPKVSFGIEQEEEEEDNQESNKGEIDGDTKEIQKMTETEDIQEVVKEVKEEIEEIKIEITKQTTTSPKEAAVAAGTGKEIQLTIDQFKMIQATKSGQQAATNAAAEKKKKKKAKKAQAQGNVTPTAALPTEEVKQQKSSPISQARPLPSQTSGVSAQTLPFTLVSGPPQTQASQAPTPAYQAKPSPPANSTNILNVPIQRAAPTTTLVSNNSSQMIQPLQQASLQPKKQSSQSNQSTTNPTTTVASRTLEDNMIDTFAELTKKYQDLSQKFQILQDQVKNQNLQTNELDRCVAKNISQVVPAVIESQLKEKLVPLVLGHIKGVDRNIRDEVIPQVEAQMQEVISKLIRQNKIMLMSREQEEEMRKKGVNVDEKVANEIRQLVIEEFARAMDQAIKPMLQESFASILNDVKHNLKFLNEEIGQKFVQEQEKNKGIIQQLSSRLELLESEKQHGSQQLHHPQGPQYQAPSYPAYHYPFYPPPPHYHPHYPPPFPHQIMPPYYPSTPNQYPAPQPHIQEFSTLRAHESLQTSHLGSAPHLQQSHSQHPNLGHYSQLQQPHPAYLQHQQQLNLTSSSNLSPYSPLQLPQPLQTNQHINYFHTSPQPASQTLAHSHSQVAQQIHPTTTVSHYQAPLPTPSFSFQHNQNVPTPSEVKLTSQSLVIGGHEEQPVLIYNDENDICAAGGLIDYSASGNLTPLSQQTNNNLQKMPSSMNNNIVPGNQIEEIKLMTTTGQSQSYPNQNNKGAPKNCGKLQLKEKSISSTGSSLQGGASIEETKESPNKKKKKKGQDMQTPEQSNSMTLSIGEQIAANTKKWQILPYMKEVATQGKSSSADFLLCGSPEFLQETVQFVSENSHIITNQYSYKIIHQFIKKVYNRAKENERARRGAAIILNVFIEKIYRVRDNMKQLVCQATQMEQEINKLIDEA